MEDEHFETFSAFAACYKPLIRPEGTLERLQRAFEIDVRFMESFRILRPHLRRHRDAWADKILTHVGRAQGGAAAFPPQHAAAFARIFRRHFGALYRGAFDAAYLDSVEDVALYMIYRDVKSVWLAGAYQRLMLDMTQAIFDHSAGVRMKPLEQALCVASKAIAIEMNQIQRVFTVYESSRLAAMLDHLHHGGAPTPTAGAQTPSPLAGLDEEARAQLRADFRVVAPNGALLAKKFFGRLLDQAPALAPFFPEDPAERRAKLARMLGVLVETAADAATAGRDLAAMAERYGPWAETRAQSEAVIEAMLWTLERALGLSWSAESERVWRLALEASAPHLRPARARDAA